MEISFLTKIYNSLKNILVYSPPHNPQAFVLGEGDADHKGIFNDPSHSCSPGQQQLERLLGYAQRLAVFMEKVCTMLRAGQWEKWNHELQGEYNLLLQQQEEIQPLQLAYTNSLGMDLRAISISLGENIKILKKIYNVPANTDIIMRSFEIPAKPPLKALLIYIDGMSDKKIITQTILRPLMLLKSTRQGFPNSELTKNMIEKFLPNGQIKRVTNFMAVQDSINNGDVALFFQGVAEALLIEAKGLEHRSPDRPLIEQSIRGSQLAFGELLKVNTALIRDTVHHSDVMTEVITLGSRGRKKCAVMYLRSIANPTLVAEVKRRINGVRTSFIGDIDVLIQFIEDHPYIPLPTTLSTERPDRVGAHLDEGRIALLMDGSSFVHILPISFFALLQSGEDFSMNFVNATFFRIIRIIGFFIATLLPAVYLAIITFHQEALPTDLLLALAGAREHVPFPGLFEIVMMELAFELTREGGLRMPGLLGPTIGVVGAIILGQAGISAGIVSPVVIIVIAVTGLASFVIPDYQIAVGMRLFRFFSLILASMMGLIGITMGLLLLTVVLCSMTSFGVPYMVPIAPKVIPGLDIFVRGPIFRQEKRPDELNPQDGQRQPHISKVWQTQDPKEGGE